MFLGWVLKLADAALLLNSPDPEGCDTLQARREEGEGAKVGSGEL